MKLQVKRDKPVCARKLEQYCLCIQSVPKMEVPYYELNSVKKYF